MSFNHEVCFEPPGKLWCKECVPGTIIKGWSSGKHYIDDFIKDKIYGAEYDDHNYPLFPEWVPFDKFININKIEGLVKACSAIWTDGKTRYTNKQKSWKSWEKLEPKPMKVGLEWLIESQNMSDEHLLNKLKTYWDLNKFYGLTEDPKTKEFVIIKQFTEDDVDTYNSIWFDEPVWSFTKSIGALNKTAAAQTEEKQATTYDTDFISVNATIYHGTSKTSHNQANQLYNLLASKKVDIDNLLESQQVYAIGPDFYENFSMPCITCWVAKPLDIQLLEKLERMFDNKFIINQVVMMPANSDTTSDSVSSTGNTESNNNEDCLDKKHAGDKNGHKSNKGSNSNDDNNDNNKGNDDSKDSRNNSSNSDDTINIISSVNAKISQNCSQGFNIFVKLFAKITNMQKGQEDHTILNYDIKTFNCSMQEMLSKRCQEAGRLGCGYFLESVKARVSPVVTSAGGKFLWKELSKPQRGNRAIENLRVREVNATANVGSTNTLGLGAVYKNIDSTKFISDEWELTENFCHKEGDTWSYKYNCNNPDDLRLNFTSESHTGEWYMIEGCGFCITITQVLRFKFNFLNNILKPKLVKCPVLIHSLEVTFKSLANFNENFKTFKPVYHYNDNYNI